MPSDTFQAFAQALGREGMRPVTIASYVSDPKGFATWFVQTTVEAFALQGITAFDITRIEATCSP